MDTLDMPKMRDGLASQDFNTVGAVLHELDRFLTLRTFVDGYCLGPFDQTLWSVVRKNKVAMGVVRRSKFANVTRWFTYLESEHADTQLALAAQGNDYRTKPDKESQLGGRYNIQLQDTENGVVTRFPPEPSGYLHIGHAKAAFLNEYFAHETCGGSLVLRFDDTNPKRERQEYEDSIKHDLGLLGVSVRRVTYTSDYFEQLYQLCRRLISDGNAYADDTPVDIQKQDRRNRIASKPRDRPADESLAMFEEMRKGTALGRKHCIRARIAFNSSNGAMRDPVIYRFPSWDSNEQPQPHNRTGWTWNIYPTYDFACPLVDSIEGITHALRTTEYADRNEQYHWFLSTLNLRRVHLWDFARISFIRTFLSKRKLARIVDSGRVSGWDDPRMPTIRGILRRGLTVAALREFMLQQGPSRNDVTMDWTILWAMNRKMIDPTAARCTAVDKEGLVTVTVAGGPDKPHQERRAKHPKNSAVGTKLTTFANRIFIDQDDAARFQNGEEITLMSWGNATVRDIIMSDDVVTSLTVELHLDGDVGSTDKKVHWLAAQGSHLAPAELWEFDYLLTKDTLRKTDKLEDYLNPVTAKMKEALLDANCRDLVEGDIIQLERKGYFRVDKAVGQGPGGNAVLFEIPTGGSRKV